MSTADEILKTGLGLAVSVKTLQYADKILNKKHKKTSRKKKRR